MTDYSEEIASALTRSFRTGQIQHLPWSERASCILDELCDDSVRTDTCEEFWGTGDDGREWRIHLDYGFKMPAGSLE